MNSIYQQALNGTLASPGGTSCSNTFLNTCMIPVDIFRCNSDASLTLVQSVLPNGQADSDGWGAQEGDYYVIQSGISGSFMMVIQLTDNSPDTVDIAQDLLCNPNDVGEIPQPTASMILPPNTPSVLVGIGLLAENGIIITREQFWARSGDSYSLGPGETREISFTQTSGLQRTSSSQDMINKSISAQAGAGWGPFSASVSAALSSSSSTMQQVSVSEESTSYVAQKFTNDPGAVPIMVLKWQLTDTITGFTSNGSIYSPSFSVQTVQTPVAISSSPLAGVETQFQVPKPTAANLANDLRIKKLARKRQMELIKRLK